MEQPAPPSSKPEPSPTEWCEIAGTALDAIRELDFEQISVNPAGWEDRLRRARTTVTQCADQAPASAARLARVQTVAELVVHSEVVREPEAALFTQPGDVSLTELIDELDELGMGDQVGRVLLQADRTTLRPLDLIPHREGLPPFDLVIAPSNSLVRGATGLFIAANELTLASVQAPIDNHPWHVESRTSFTNRAELIERLSSYIHTTE